MPRSNGPWCVAVLTLFVAAASDLRAQVVVGPIGGAYSNGLGIGVFGELQISEHVWVAPSVVYGLPGSLRYFWEVNGDLLLAVPVPANALVQPFLQLGLNFAWWGGVFAANGVAPNLGVGIRIRRGRVRLVAAAKAEIREGGPGALMLGLGLPVAG